MGYNPGIAGGNMAAGLTWRDRQAKTEDLISQLRGLWYDAEWLWARRQSAENLDRLASVLTEIAATKRRLDELAE